MQVIEGDSGLLRPHLKYGICLKKDKLERLQRRAIKMNRDLENMRDENTLEDLESFRLEKRRLRRNVIEQSIGHSVGCKIRNSRTVPRFDTDSGCELGLVI